MLITTTGEVKVIRGQGMPSYRHHDFGNLYIQFDVKFPERINGPDDAEGYPGAMSKEQIKALESVLPPRAPQTTPSPNSMTEDYSLEKVDPMQEGGRARGATGEDDEEGMGAGGERVQCASQ